MSRDVHQPLHLPAALAGGPQLLGPRPAPAPPGADPLGQVRLLGGHLAGGDGSLGLPERLDAGNEFRDDRAFIKAGAIGGRAGFDARDFDAAALFLCY